MTTAKINLSLLAKALLILLVLVNAVPSYSQPGCKDPLANNYNSAATINDGSCTYNITTYTPPLKTVINAALLETSGLQMAGNFLWSFNDGGGAAAIYRIDTLSNALLQTVNLQGATNVDWEDIAFDGTNFYVGDFGNNANGARTDLKIYKFPLSAIDADYTTNPTVTIPTGQVEVINFTYSDQSPVVATTANNTKYDCEAMIVDGGKIHLFTKNWIDISTTHYVINNLAAGTYPATPVDTLATGYLVTGADKAVGQNIVALLGYQNAGFANHFMYLLTDYSGGNYFNGNKRRIDLPNATIMGQAEGITFRDGNYGYISNEKFLTVNQNLRSFDISSFIPLYVLPLTLKSFNVSNSNNGHKITWAFDDAVQNVQVQYSTDGINFTVLKTYGSSVTGTFYNPTASPVNYYRIAWQKNNLAMQFSNIISIRNEQKKSLVNFLLKANGELSFNVSSSTPEYYTFKFASTDGRILSQINKRAYMPGSNKIYVSKQPILSNLVCLIAYNDKERITAILHVEK